MEKMWADAGASTKKIGAREHDELVAHSSHLIHLAAFALTVAALDCEGDENLRKLRELACASGFRDTTRVASSSPTMWREIIENNSGAVMKSLDSFEKAWKAISNSILTKDFDGLEREIGKAKTLRDRWVSNRGTAGGNQPSSFSGGESP